MSINRLSVVNDMLALLGELPINDLNSFHPVVPRALSTLDTANETVQSGKWWFNTEYPTLVPQEETKFIMLPTDCLSADSLTEFPRVTKRGARLYNLDKSTYEFSAPFVVEFQRLIPYDDLSSIAKAYIRVVALLSFNNSIDGDGAKTSSLNQERQITYTTFNAEHIRHQRTNMFNRPGVQNTLSRMVGTKRNMLKGR